MQLTNTLLAAANKKQNKGFFQEIYRFNVDFFSITANATYIINAIAMCNTGPCANGWIVSMGVHCLMAFIEGSHDCVTNTVC